MFFYIVYVLIKIKMNLNIPTQVLSMNLTQVAKFWLVVTAQFMLMKWYSKETKFCLYFLKLHKKIFSTDFYTIIATEMLVTELSCYGISYAGYVINL